LDADGKPHVFDDRDAEPVAKAARLMGFRAVRVNDAKLKQVASELPKGRLFATGRGLVPFVKRTLYDKLAALIGTDAELKLPPEPNAADQGKPSAAAKEPPTTAKEPPPTAGKEPPTAGSKEPPTAAKKPSAATGKGQAPATKKAAPASTASKSTVQPDLWDAIGVGSLVLVHDGFKEGSWWEAIVIAVSEDGEWLTARWRDYPGEPLVRPRRRRVGLLAPTRTTGA
jgi:hypothetical protein